MNFQTAFFHWGRGGVCVWLGGGGGGVGGRLLKEVMIWSWKGFMRVL